MPEDRYIYVCEAHGEIHRYHLAPEDVITVGEVSTQFLGCCCPTCGRTMVCYLRKDSQ